MVTKSEKFHYGNKLALENYSHPYFFHDAFCLISILVLMLLVLKRASPLFSFGKYKESQSKMADNLETKRENKAVSRSQTD